MTDSDEYKTWLNIKQRCTNKNLPDYKDYGGRGIKVCDRWFNSFQNFYADMGPRPSKKHSIDRIDNNKNYSPDNCKWSTNKEQTNNKRNNRKIEFMGKVLSRKEWSEITGIKVGTIISRIEKMKWSVEKALTYPVRNCNR